MALCLSASLSVCHKSVFYQKWWIDRVGFSLCSIHPIPYVLQGNSGISKIKGTFLWNFVQVLDVWNFAMASRSRVVNKTRRRSSLLTTLTRSPCRGWTRVVYCTSVDRNAITPSLRFVVDLLYNSLLYSCAAVDKISTATARRAVPLR